jgi:hypothetical protein
MEPDPMYEVYLHFNDTGESHTVDLHVAAIPREREVIMWRQRGRSGYRRYRVSEVCWSLDDSDKVDRSVGLTLVHEPEWSVNR